MPSNRPLKVADRIREIVAAALESRVKDPRLGFVTITDVRVTGDLQQASVFFTVLGDEAARDASAIALNSAKGMLRSEVGHALGLRVTPTLEFIHDGLQESAAAMNDLMFEVARKDAELRKAREKGMAIVLISADLEELIGMSDRLLVMLRGEVTAELNPANTTPESLGAAMTGAKK